MPRVSDDELRFHAKSDGPQPLQDIARELLAARAAVPLLKLLYDKWEDGDVGMSDGYRDDGTGTEDWGVTRITDQIAAWSERRNGLDFYADRLRTTAAALRTFIDSKRETGWVISAGENAGPALNKALPNARAILARLEQEGLT